jgi:hypothetical protein
MILISFLIYLIYYSRIECDDIKGKWQTVVITEDRQLVDTCIRNISNSHFVFLLDKIKVFDENFQYTYQDDWSEIEGKYLIKNTCDSIAIYIQNNNTASIKFNIKYTLIEPKILLFEYLGSQGTEYELLIGIK